MAFKARDFSNEWLSSVRFSTVSNFEKVNADLVPGALCLAQLG